ncbi:MAG TPA: histidine phosphatase family protein [Maritimibacter sp.]|nr:histidine phosphatase family protein [Maritimibacter sp.]
MSDLTLVRHGQANNTSQDEDGYDMLSDLGHQQAAWLGDYFRASGEGFDRVYSGTMRRHRETAAAMGYTGVTEDERLNEVAYFDLAQKMHEQFGIKHPTDREEFIEHLPLVFTAWRDGQIEGTLETFQNFEDRVSDVLHEIAAGKGRALVATSGGLISMGIRVSMGLEIGSMARMALAIMNTSVHQLHPIGTALSLTQFNAVPHLADPSRAEARTWV